jgi:MarR family transcriptional regulator for hemolysin
MARGKAARGPREAVPPRIFSDRYASMPAAAATRRIMLIGRRYRRLIDQALKDVGHSQIRWEILHTISIVPEDCTLMEVAAHLGLEGPSIVATMEKLDTGGFIERRENGADRRSRLIRLTDQGRAAVTLMASVVDAQRDLLWAGIPGEDIETMLDILTRMRRNVWSGEPED